MSTYIGGRIIPTHAGTWDETSAYETLSIVLDEESGNSYISRKAVPSGTALDDEEYWQLFSLYSEQVAEAVDQIETVVDRLDSVETRLDANLTASTDEDADYAAEVVDARVGADDTVYSSLGEHIRAGSNVHIVAFLNADGSILQISVVQDGKSATAPEDPTLPDDGETAYTFAGWDTDYTEVTDDLVVTATYTSSVQHVIDGVIQDSWEELLEAVNNGLEQEYYSVGDKIELDLGDQGVMQMEIMGFQIDELADGSGYAPITFCADGLLTTPHTYNDNAYETDDDGNYVEGTGSVGGWEQSGLRSYLYSDILPLLPDEVQAALAEVTREQQGYNTSGSRVMQSCTDTIWVPGRWYDISKWYSDDPDTAAVVDDWGGLRYTNAGNAYIAWLRDGPALDYANTVSDAGYVRSTQVYTERYIILAFCVGVSESSTDSEDETEQRLTALEEGTISSIVCWGDSLTYQGGWTDVLAEKTGLTVYNAGVGGDTSACIAARQGADPVVVSDITIPAACTAVQIGESAEDGGLTTYLGRSVFLSIPGSANPYLNPVMIGDIEGKITFDGDSYTDDGGVWYFTRSEAGTSTEITRPTAVRTYYDRVHNRKDELLILYAVGTNGGYDDIADLIAQQKQMIDHFKGKEYVVCGLTWAQSSTDKSEYDAAMIEAFGRRYINVRGYITHPIYDDDGETIISCWGLEDAGLEATDDDLDAIASGEMPPQLLEDTKHYTETLQTVIGNYLYTQLRDLNLV